LFWSNNEARYFLRDLLFSQGCCWEFTSSGMWHRVTRWAVLDVSKDSCAFVFRVKREESYNQDVGNCNTYCIILELKLSVLLSACADVCWLYQPLIAHVSSMNAVKKLLYIKHDWQCIYNLTLWRVHETIVAVEAQKCILCFLRLSHKGHDFQKKNHWN
jgi:hypothetical protein